MRRPIVFLVLSVLLAMEWSTELPDAHSQQQEDGPCWLLESDKREFLSGAAETALMNVCSDQLPGGEGFAPKDRELLAGPAFLGKRLTLAPANLLVNDPTADIPDSTTQSETAIAVYGSTVIVGYNDSGEFLPLTPGVSSYNGYARSVDAGATFTDLGKLLPVPGGFNLGHPDIAVDSSGNFYYSMMALDATLRSMIGVAKSTNGGLTFGPPVDASPGTSRESFQVNAHIAVDNGGPFDSNIYVSWSEFSLAGIRILFSRSTDRGATFSAPIALSAPGAVTQGSFPAVGPNGEVYVAWEDFGTPGGGFTDRSIRIRRSDDGGVTFGPEVTIASVSRIGALTQCGPPGFQLLIRETLNGALRTHEFPSIGVDTSLGSHGGNVYAVWNSDPDGAGPDMSDVFLSRSADKGVTWSVPVRLNDDPTTNDNFFPFVSVAPDGTVAAMWYDRRLDLDNFNIDVFKALSTDGGQTFGPNIRVTDVSFAVPPINGQPTFSGNFDPIVAPCYMGEYNHMAADRSSFYLAWGDNRNTVTSIAYPDGRPDPDVFFEKQPVVAVARPVGGVAMPVNKLELLGPWLGLAFVVAIIAAKAVTLKRRRV